MKAYSSPRCPQDAAHGPLLPWPSRFAGFYCPHQAHDANPFYRTDLSPAIRPPGESVIPAQTAGTPVLALSPRRRTPSPASAPEHPGTTSPGAGVAGTLGL